MTRYERDLFDDVFQAGCEAYLRYSTPTYFPRLSIRYYMLNEITFWKYESSYQNNKTQKTIVRQRESYEDQVGHDESERALARLDIQRIIQKAKVSDSRGRSKHIRTIQLLAEYGSPKVKGERKNLPVKADTYWSACRSLTKFVKNEFVSLE